MKGSDVNAVKDGFDFTWAEWFLVWALIGLI